MTQPGTKLSANMLAISTQCTHLFFAVGGSNTRTFLPVRTYSQVAAPPGAALKSLKQPCGQHKPVTPYKLAKDKNALQLVKQHKDVQKKKKPAYHTCRMLLSF